MDQQEEKAEIHEPARSGGVRGRWWVVAVCLILAGIYSLVIKPQSDAQGQKARPAQPRLSVLAAPVKKKDVGVYITGIGSVVPLNTVTVKTRVDGEVMKVFYHEGQFVKRGDLLVQIDPRPYQIQLMQASGQLMKDESLLKNAQTDLERYQVLWKQDSIPQQQLVTQESLVKQYEGAIKTDQGAVSNANLQLDYSRITAPISGRAGLRLVDSGNIVHPADTTGLVVITQLQPITVVFPISEDELPKVLKRLKTDSNPAVEAFDRGQQTKLATGKLLAVDNQIDPATGTVRIKAVFPNTDNELFPNQFVNARLFIDHLRGATVVPAEAIQRGPQGAFVYVVKSDKTVIMRPVGLGVTQEDEVVVKTGLTPGELVVVEGADRLREGSKVAVKIQGVEPKNKRQAVKMSDNV